MCYCILEIGTYQYMCRLLRNNSLFRSISQNNDVDNSNNSTNYFIVIVTVIRLIFMISCNVIAFHILLWHICVLCSCNMYWLLCLYA